MEYRALYRKHRPQRFSEVIGQDHVTTTLTREVVERKVAHAYLFAGPRGTGKTTTARLLAKALNCEDRLPDGEPCNECQSCEAIAVGTSLDVIELDAASHNKVEDIREIRINVGTVAVAPGARRVYILDEAHMLSRAAGNALLKTLEEPPDHVVFVLATTEPYKLLDTIRSRAQRFDFQPVPVEVLTGYVREIADREGFVVDSESPALIATHAKGSVRDALSLLEQVAAFGGNKVEADAITRALGLADNAVFTTLAKAVVDQDAPAALGLVATLSARGTDLRRFVAEAVGFFRGVFLAQYSPNLEEVVDEPFDVLDEWRRQAAAIPSVDVLRAVDELSEALYQLRQGREERLVVELALLRLTRPDTAQDIGALASRVARLEARVRELGSQVALGATTPSEQAKPLPEPGARARPVPDAAEPNQRDRASTTAVAETPASPVSEEPESESGAPEAPAAGGGALLDLDIERFESVWPAIVARIREDAGPRRHALLKEARPKSVVGSTVVFELPSHLPFHLEQLRADRDLHLAVSAIARQVLGGDITLQFDVADDAADQPSPEAQESGAVPKVEDLLEEGADGTDATALVVDILGGEVVGE